VLVWSEAWKAEGEKDSFHNLSQAYAGIGSCAVNIASAVSRGLWLSSDRLRISSLDSHFFASCLVKIDQFHAFEE
jgi:hypothetical protein